MLDSPLATKAALEMLGDFAKTGETKSMSVDSDPDGGYATSPQLSAQIRLRAVQVSTMRRDSGSQALTDSDTFEEPVVTNLPDAEWVGEKEARPGTNTPSMAKTTIPTNELYCNPPVSQRLLDSSKYNVGQMRVNRIGRKFGKKEGAAFVSGDGIKKPKGFLSYTLSTSDDDSRTWGELQYGVSGDASTILPDALIDFVGKLAPEYRGNARWRFSRTTEAVISKLKDSQNQYLWYRSIAAGQPSTLLGYPISIDDDMPAVAANAFPIALGDWREGYCVVDAKNMTILRDPYTNKPYVHFYTVQRVGGGVLDFDAIKTLKIST